MRPMPQYIKSNNYQKRQLLLFLTLIPNNFPLFISKFAT